MPNIQTDSKITNRKYFFTFYSEELKKAQDNIAANIIAILYEENNRIHHIDVYERNTKNVQIKAFEICQDEISNIKNEIGNYIKPTKIKTIFALKKAIFSMIND